jgi:hypothetical protein
MKLNDPYMGKMVQLQVQVKSTYASYWSGMQLFVLPS